MSFSGRARRNLRAALELFRRFGFEQGTDEETVRVGLALEPPVASAGDEGEGGGARFG